MQKKLCKPSKRASNEICKTKHVLARPFEKAIHIEINLKNSM